MARRPQDPGGWHPEDIKAELRKRYGSITSLAVSWGYGRGAISAALHRDDFSSPVERRIADALGVTPHTLWPDRWLPDGARRSNSAIRADRNRRASPQHSQNREVA